MNLVQYPSYYDKADPETQLKVVRNYLKSLTAELEDSMNNVTYDMLDSGLRDMFDDFEENLYMVERANTSVATLGNKLQKVLNDYVTSQMLAEAMDEVADDMESYVDRVCGELQNAIDAVARDLGDLKTAHENLKGSVERIAEDVAWLKNYAVTTENSETVISAKKLVVDKLVANTSVTSPNYYNPS